MSDKKFSIPKIKRDPKKTKQWRKEALDQANSQAPHDTAYLPPDVSAIIFTILSVTPLFACYGVVSLPIFILAVIGWIIGISVFWRKRNEAEKLENMDIPAEELILNDQGFHWKKMSDNPEILDIGWDDFEIISFDPDDYYLKVKNKPRIKHSRIMHGEVIRSQIIHFIEQNTKLVKMVENKQWRDEDYVAISFRSDGQGLSGTDSNTSSLEKFKSGIDQMDLIRSAEYYYHQGESLMANNEFDDAIAEFVKVILISSPQDKSYRSATKALKTMGFSEADIKNLSS